MQIEGNYETLRARLETDRLAAGRRAVDGGNRPDDKLYETCQEFEAIFIKQMLNVMRKTVTKGEILHGGFAEEIFEDMLYDEYSKAMARNAGFGLSDLLYRQLGGEARVPARATESAAAYAGSL